MFRLCNVAGRAALDVDGQWFDLAGLADDESLSDPMVAVGLAASLDDLVARCDRAAPGGAVAEAPLLAPVPRPRQVFAVGLNYAGHATESGMEAPPAPLTFTKFPSSIGGPFVDVPLSGPMVDWEVEIVAVVGTRCAHVEKARAWDVLAGLTLGQDISDRQVQLAGSPRSSRSARASPPTPPSDPPSCRSTPSRTLTTSTCGATCPASGCKRPGRAS